MVPNRYQPQEWAKWTNRIGGEMKYHSISDIVEKSEPRSIEVYLIRIGKSIQHLSNPYGMTRATVWAYDMTIFHAHHLRIRFDFSTLKMHHHMDWIVRQCLQCTLDNERAKK